MCLFCNGKEISEQFCIVISRSGFFVVIVCFVTVRAYEGKGFPPSTHGLNIQSFLQLVHTEEFSPACLQFLV